MSEDKIVNGYYQSNITTARKYENSTYTMKYAIDKLQQENQQLKEVIEEVREYTEELKPHWLGNDLVLNIIDYLLQILDKAKEVISNDIW